MKHASHPLIAGTLILTFTSLLSRLIGFFYRIFLSRTIGAEGLGVYQMVFPVYIFCFTLSAAGIQSAISRCCASALEKKDLQAARNYFLTGTSISLFISLVCSVFLHHYAGFLCLYLLKEMRCAPLLSLAAWALPAAVLHACISAWYFARQQTHIPAVSQLIEQLVRVGSTLLVYRILLEQGGTPSAQLAVIGILAGELASMLFSLICYLFSETAGLSSGYSADHSGRMSQNRISELLSLSLPLTANRVLLTLLQSAEAVLIPWHLEQSGMSPSQALRIYGIFTGMALPFLLFPSAVTTSLSTMLLPKIARDQASGQTGKIIQAAERTIQGCLILGIGAAGIFFFFGEPLGTAVFHQSEAGSFLQILSLLCPLLYLTTTLNSILNGLGHTGLCFLQNLTGLTLRILFVVFAIPIYGIRGYLWGLLCSQLVMSLLNLCFLHKYVPFQIHPFSDLIVPLASVLIGCTVGKFLLLHIPVLSGSFSLLTAIALGGGIYLICLTGTGILLHAK